MPSITTLACSSPVARVKNGTVSGVHSPSYNQDFFLGVPFAQPPIGDLRFRQAQSLNTTWKGTRNAKEYATHCVGYGLDQIFYKASEDCLYLNVVRPPGYDNKKHPVAFWIHGGTFTNGTSCGGADQRYNLSFIVEQSVKIGRPIIGITINYRLSLWGFTSSNELANEGLLNIGLKDQRLALHWVQENIKVFGGDPKKVTIFGESAGAASVGFHVIPSSTARNAVQTPHKLPSTPSSLNLRETPFSTLNATMNGTLSSTGSFAPVTDGDFIQDYGSVQLSKGQFVKVPIMRTLPLALQNVLLEAYPDDLATNVIAALGPNRPASVFGQQFRRVATYVGDQLFMAPRRQTAVSWAAHNATAYAYRFNADQAGFATELAVSHFKEIRFVFNNIEGVGFRLDIKPFARKPASYVELADFVSKTWVSFVHGLDLNGWRGGNTTVAHWPEYGVEDPRDFVFEVNRTSGVEADTWRKEGIDFINQNALAVYAR
ncbi:alpha/beta-hydrolase [Lizonia empirigonia]|nr:alpha/beta-hydrolase [Lizonia empirigonia]